MSVLAVVLLMAAADQPPSRPGDVCHGGGVLTPYRGWVAPEEFLQGAAIDVSSEPGSAQALVEDLRTMRDRYHINTVNLYGLESWDAGGSDTRMDRLFSSLRELGMRAVIRIEWYPPGFAFQDADAQAVIQRYQPLLSYLSAPARRDLTAYFAVNMPLDDPAVRDRLGGANSAASGALQQAYARTVVDGLRGVLGGAGFASARLYLGVFYGWDGTYAAPSYAGARPDGYFLTSYSYPGSRVPDYRAPDAELINQPALEHVMRRFRDQYGHAPVVVEYGFHTVEFNHGVVPAQTAGLVADVLAKSRALLATTEFYRSGYPNVRGTLYFGYHIVKTEGVPASVLDFALDPGGCRNGRQAPP